MFVFFVCFDYFEQGNLDADQHVPACSRLQLDTESDCGNPERVRNSMDMTIVSFQLSSHMLHGAGMSIPAVTPKKYGPIL